MFPKAGGQYVYLKEAYNPLAGFLYGWSFFAVIQTATIAAVGVAFSKFLAYIYPPVSENLVAFSIRGFNISPAQFVAIGVIVFLTFINTLGENAGKLIVTIIYVTTNLMYTAVLPLNEIAGAEKDRVAVAASQVIFGNFGTVVIALMIMISTFGCINGLVLAGARVYYTMAHDGLFFKQAGVLNKNAVPQ